MKRAPIRRQVKVNGEVKNLPYHEAAALVKHGAAEWHVPEASVKEKREKEKPVKPAKPEADPMPILEPPAEPEG